MQTVWNFNFDGPNENRFCCVLQLLFGLHDFGELCLLTWEFNTDQLFLFNLCNAVQNAPAVKKSGRRHVARPRLPNQ